MFFNSLPKRGCWMSHPLHQAKRGNPLVHCCPGNRSHEPVGVILLEDEGKQQCGLQLLLCDPGWQASSPQGHCGHCICHNKRKYCSGASVSLAESGGWLNPSHIFGAFCSAFQRGLFLFHRRGLRSDPLHADLQGLGCRGQAQPTLPRASLCRACRVGRREDAAAAEDG